MANLRVLFAVVFLSAFLSTKIMVHGSGDAHPTNANVDITEGMQISGDVSPPNETWSRDSGVLGFPCDSKACLSLCYPLGKAQQNGGCAEDNAASNITLKIRTPMYNDDQEIYADDRDFELLIDDPCAFSWMASWVSEDFYVLPNGTIYAADFEGGSHFDFEYYCLFREPKSTVYSAKVCRPWIIRVYWQISCLIFATFVMLAILVVYSVVPELGNLHGMVFRAYVATYITAHLLAITYQLSSGSRTYNRLFSFIAVILRYCGCCCALWLNVMSFNIWRSFRNLRSIVSHNREQDRQKFIRYTIYVFLTPAILIMIAATVMYYAPHFNNFLIHKTLILWTCSGLITTVVICNMFLHISTALSIRRHEKDTAHVTHGVNKHHDADKQWFNLHVNLFVITGCHTLLWVIWEQWPTPVFTSVLYVSEGLRSILIFVIFIWKDNVKRLVRKRLGHSFIRLKSTYGRNHTASTCGSRVFSIKISP